jgi:hypothetical protein
MQRPACLGQSTLALASLRHPGSACQRQHWLHGGGAHGQTALGRTNERRRLWGEGPDGSGQ